jgi:hypothetical protein
MRREKLRRGRETLQAVAYRVVRKASKANTEPMRFKIAPIRCRYIFQQLKKNVYIQDVLSGSGE